MDMTICRKCGTSNQDGKKFCVFCNELLVADPVEMAKREAAAKKKLDKQRKKLEAKHKRWKRALFMLIPICVLDLFDLLLCLDIALLGIGKEIGGMLGELLCDYVGTIVSLFGNDVYTVQMTQYVLLGMELLAAIALLTAATVLAVIMIVRMIKWRVYLKRGDAKEQALEKDARKLGAAPDAKNEDLPVEQAAAEVIKTELGQTRVSYASLVQLDEQREAYTMPEPISETDCKTLHAALASQLWEYDEDSVRRILSAMAASRMLLCSAGAIDSASMFANLSRAFGVKAEQYTCPAAMQDAADAGIAQLLLQQDAESGVVSHTAFAHALYTAGFSPKNICFAGVSGVSAAGIASVFSPLRPYFGLPDGNVSLFLGEADAQNSRLPVRVEENEMILSPNVWVLGVLPEQDRVPVVGDAMGQYCAAVYLRNSGKAFGDEAEPLALPSVDALERAIASAENAYYLPEELWRVIDHIEQQVQEMGGARLSNRTLRMLERYTAVYLAAGGKQSDAFDNGFAAILLPAYAEQLQMIAKRENGETLAAMLDRMVGRESLPVTIEALTLMGLV